MSSDVLGRDIEEVREKVERLAAQRNIKEGQAVKSAKEGVVKCYLSVNNLFLFGRVLAERIETHRDHPDRPLDCWKEVEQFKSEVSKLEQVSSVLLHEGEKG